MRRYWSALVIAIAFGAMQGCSGGSEDRPELFPVKGAAKYNGQSMTGGCVSLVPVTHDSRVKIPPFGLVDEDGVFQITTYETGDGAPAGDYSVTVSWSDDDVDSPSDLFKGRYRNPKKPVAKFTVKEGANEIPLIDLKGPPVKK
jgi:hypothetical protein